MEPAKFSKTDIDNFVLDEIDSVPHLEALLILRSQAPKPLSPEEASEQLYIPLPRALGVLQDLVRRNLAQATDDGRNYSYAASGNRDLLIAQVEITYRRELLRISNMIHSKASPAVRDFARAFRITKDGQ